MNNRRIITVVGMVALTLITFGQAVAGQFSVKVKNLTTGITFTPLLITAHDGNTYLFKTGEPASAALQAMAEGGDISALLALVGGADKDTVADPANGLLGPGLSLFS